MMSLRTGMSQVQHVLTTNDMTNIALRMLACINREVVLHSIRTAYLSYKIASVHPMNEKCSMQNLVMLALFHTIGFFREDITLDYCPHEANLSYFSNEKTIECKYVFACFYLEFMTPLKDDALALQNFLQPHNKDLRAYLYQEEYKDIIYLCARISDFTRKNKDSPLPEDLNELAPGFFDPEYVEAFNQANKDNILIEKIKHNTHTEELSDFIATISYTQEENKLLEKMLVQLLDFKSTSTMKHSINTSCYALSLGLRMQLNEKDLTVLFNSAFLHDIGKIATPQRILEFPGKLSPEDMGIMRHHVNHSKRILSGFVSDEIIETVYRHHEKLNGKGYPQKIDEKDLTIIQRILTVADITSALNDSRSYKGEFSKEKTISIISKMAEDGEIDPQITKFIIDDFDIMLQEQQILQTMLSVDFSKVITSYHDFIMNDAESIADSAINEKNSETTELEELDDLEDLDDLEELEEL